MTITEKRIAELAEKKGVRTLAVENFLRSLGSLSERDASANLELDARLYRWNAPTVAAIRTGIREAFSAVAHDARKRRVSVDRAWQQEQAMQAGMGLGIEAFNDAMGYELDAPEEDR